MADYTPTVAEVAALIATRTIDIDGNSEGTFTDTTRPTAEQALELCDAAVADLEARLGVEVPDELAPEAQRLAAFQAACLIEQSYYPEAAAAHGRVPQYAAQYLAGVAALAELLHGLPVRLR